MSSILARIAAAFLAMVVAVLLAACTTSPGTAEEDPSVDPRIPESPVIAGQPASHNAEDISFATNIIAEHQRAIDMLKLVPDRSTNPELSALASRISEVQQPEINIMNVFLVQWRENPDLGTDSSPDPGQGTATPLSVDDATMVRLDSLSGKEFDTLWLESMIRHHRGSIEIADAEIADGANVDARDMAETMVATLEAEIVEMKQMLESSEP